MAADGKTEKTGGRARRYGGLTRLAAAVPGLGDKAMRRRGFAESRIVSDWQAIVGAVMEADCAPEKLVFPRGATGGGTLHLRVAGAAALEIQHQLPLLIERINTVFGYTAIQRIVLKQGPLPERRRSTRPRLRKLAPAEEQAVGSAVSGVGREDLRAALEGLGKAVAAKAAKASASKNVK